MTDLPTVTGYIAAALLTAGCGPGVRESGVADSTAVPSSVAAPAPVVEDDSIFTAAPDSAWVPVVGLTLVAFYPVVSNDSLEKDADLATVLDDLSYHIGSAMDSLVAQGVTVHYRGGDTLWLRTGAGRARVVRMRDSSDVGYVFADTLGRRVVLYGLRSNLDLLEYTREFRATGAIRPR